MKNIVGEEFKSNSHKVKAEKAAEKLPDKKVEQITKVIKQIVFKKNKL